MTSRGPAPSCPAPNPLQGERRAGETPPPHPVGPGRRHLTRSGQSPSWQGPGHSSCPGCARSSLQTGPQGAATGGPGARRRTRANGGRGRLWQCRRLAITGRPLAQMISFFKPPSKCLFAETAGPPGSDPQGSDHFLCGPARGHRHPPALQSFGAPPLRVRGAAGLGLQGPSPPTTTAACVSPRPLSPSMHTASRKPSLQQPPPPKPAGCLSWEAAERLSQRTGPRPSQGPRPVGSSVKANLVLPSPTLSNCRRRGGGDPLPKPAAPCKMWGSRSQQSLPGLHKPQPVPVQMGAHD